VGLPANSKTTHVLMGSSSSYLLAFSVSDRNFGEAGKVPFKNHFAKTA